MSKMVFQISDSGAFSEPANGLELLPTNYGVGQMSRYGVVKIIGRKGGISQYMGVNRKQFSIGGAFLGDAESMSTKRQALENLLWSTDSAQRGKSVSMSVIYRDGWLSVSYPEAVKNPDFEEWITDTDLEDWNEAHSGGAWTKSTDKVSGDFSARFDSTNTLGSPRIWQSDIAASELINFTFSFAAKISGPFGGLQSLIRWKSDSSELSTSEFDYITSTSWETYSITGTSPANTNRFDVELYANPTTDSGVTASTYLDNFIDNHEQPTETWIPGYTESQNINIKGYNISQRRGAKNIYDVSIDVEEEY